jgi:hypothetical protein
MTGVALTTISTDFMAPATSFLSLDYHTRLIFRRWHRHHRNPGKGMLTALKLVNFVIMTLRAILR